MPPVSRLGHQIQEIIATLDRIGATSALIGGLALAPYKVVRATQDIDLLANAEQADTIDRELLALGYRCIHRSGDAGNYLRGDERVDVLYASRPVARRLLADAETRDTPFGALRVISLEGLIAFKLQGLVNDPRRTQDLEDIRALLRANRNEVNRVALREHFRRLTGRHSWMNSSPKSPETKATSPARAVLVAEGGVASTAHADERNPFKVLDDLMCVVEALCPVWPARPPFGPMPDLRL